MSLQDWLITAGVLVMIVIVADGIRRMRKRGRLKLDIDKQFEDLPDTDLSAELPNGGARPAGPSDSVSSADADVDLLMDEGLKGVGQGADDWSQSKAKQPTFKYQSNAPADGPKSEPVFKHQTTPSRESLETKSVTPADIDERVEPVFSDDEIDLLQDKPLEEESRERLIVENTDSLDEGVVGPVRVRKVVTAADDESSRQSQQESVTDTLNPAFSVVSREEPKQDFDFNKPVTELMADRIPMPAVSEGSAETKASQEVDDAVPEPVEEPETVSASLGPAAETDSPRSAPEGELPLIAESREPEPERSVEKKTRKQRKSKKPSRIQRWKEEIQTSFFDIDPGLDPEQPETKDPEFKEPSFKEPDFKQSGFKESGLGEAEPSEPSEPVAAEPAENTEPQVLVMSVTAADSFQGSSLFKLVEACGMEFGEMDIYHRYENGPGQGAIQFSMVNGVQPGHFNPAEREIFSTPALSFFLQMGEPKELMQAFECMLATAQCVADNLGGEVKDENRSVMRAQTIEHYRQQVRDFERRRLARRA